MRGKYRDVSAIEVALTILGIISLPFLLVIALAVIGFLFSIGSYVVWVIAIVAAVGAGAYGIGWYLTTQPKPKQKRKRGAVQDES